MPPRAVFNLDNPQIGVKIPLPRRQRVGLRLRQRILPVSGRPYELLILPHLHQHMRRPVQPVDLEQQRPALRIAAPHHDNRHALRRRRPDLRPDDYMRG